VPGTVWPRSAPRPTDSKAEQRLWEHLRGKLPDGWTAWHSLRVRDRKGYLGEGDFVLAHPERGLLVLEVKGGLVELRGGLWYSNDRRLEKAPLDQGHTFLRRLLDRLGEWSCAPPAWGAAVAFPDTDFDDQPWQDDLRGVVLGRNHLAWLDRFLPAVVERALPKPQAARGDWTKRLHQMWGETWIPSLSLGTRVEQGRERWLSLDEVQLSTLDLLAEQDRALVQGGAGSGKTLLAVEAARREAAAGRRVLLLCFTQPLCKWLRARLAGTGVEVQTVSGLAKAEAEAVDGPSRDLDMSDSSTWNRYCERAADVCAPRWDAVLVDEAQDLTFEAWYFVGRIAEGRRLWAFHDPGQRFWADRSPPPELFPPPFRLGRGKRSPPGIEALARRYLGEAADDAAIRAAVADRTLALVPCPAPSATADCVGAEIDRLLSERVALRDIGVVSLRGQGATDAVHHAPRLGRHEFASAGTDDMEERLVADTFLRWKGLERPVVIVADVTGPERERFGTRMHIALTRALAAARIVAAPVRPGEEWPGLR
jgi:hypothetical protein